MESKLERHSNYKLTWNHQLSDTYNPMKTQIGGKHYLDNDNPIELVELITQYFGFSIGSAVKYIIRCTHKSNPFMDLGKVVHYMALYKNMVNSNKLKPRKLNAETYSNILDKLYSYQSLGALKQRVILLLIDWAQDFKSETQDKFIVVLHTLLCVAADTVRENMETIQQQYTTDCSQQVNLNQTNN